PRQLRRQALRRRLADRHARARAARARERTGPAHHGAVAAALERGRRLEARLQQPGEAHAGTDCRAAPGVREREGDHQGHAGAQVSKPFTGIRIRDFTRYLAGPYGTYQLGLLGADVIKIESRDGDETRGQLVAAREWVERKMPPGFLAVNANKRSLTLDLRRPEAVEIVKRLVTTADVVWENFRPGVMDKLGLGYD